MGLSRQLRITFFGTALVVAAFSTGISFLFFLVYLLGILMAGSWWYARRGLRGMRAGYHVLNPRAQVGELLEAVYRVDNGTAWSKPWVELSNDSTLPAPLPGRAIGIRANGSRQWLAKVTLLRRGSFRLGALRVRTGDPFGLFTTEMVVGRPTSIVVFPKVVELPNWRLPPSPVDGTTPSRRRYEASSPLVSTVRPYVYGDPYNRIHWLSSVRHGELHVKEFDLDGHAIGILPLELRVGGQPALPLQRRSLTVVDAGGDHRGEQPQSLVEADRRLAVLREQNDEMEAQLERLSTPEEIERILRHIQFDILKTNQLPIARDSLETKPKERRVRLGGKSSNRRWGAG